MNCPKISILIANYNNGHFFKDCYDSLIAQTELNWEALVIDDCSTDNSAEIIKSLISEDTRFRFFQNEENIGYQKTLIRGIELSETPIFARLDPDDALKAKAIELSLEAFSSNSEIGMTYTGFVFCDEKCNPCCETVPYYGSHDTSAKIKDQIKWRQETKLLLWSEIVAEKIIV